MELRLLELCYKIVLSAVDLTVPILFFDTILESPKALK